MLLRRDLQKVQFGNNWPFLKHDTSDASFNAPILLPGLSCFSIALTQYTILLMIGISRIVTLLNFLTHTSTSPLSIQHLELTLQARMFDQIIKGSIRQQMKKWHWQNK